MSDQDCLTVSAEEHEVGFPMSGVGAIARGGGTFDDGNPALDEARGRAAFTPAPAALGFCPGQIVPPGTVAGAADLGMDEAVDAFMADGFAGPLASRPAGDLFGRQAAGEAVEHELAQRVVSFEARPGPAPRPRLLVGIAWLVANLLAPVPSQLARDRR